MTVLRRDHPERVNWSDPTGQKAMQLPEWQWERIVEMVEYLHVTYGTEGLIRGEDGRIIATEEGPSITAPEAATWRISAAGYRPAVPARMRTPPTSSGAATGRASKRHGKGSCAGCCRLGLSAARRLGG